MCGIAGGIGLTTDARPDPQRIEAISAGMGHRGPDGSGLWISPSRRAVLAHRRLAVIDLATGSQPMVDETNGMGIVFNGEIYNYLELKEELSREGEVFHTNSDTEVLLRLIKNRGESCLSALRGMFAFIAWNDHQQKLFVARDRIGKKPLFYSTHGDCLYFSSSLAALRAGGAVKTDIDPQALDLYLSLGYIPAPHTIYRNTFKLPAASFATLGTRGLQVSTFWDLANNDEVYSGSYETALEELLEKLEEAVALRLRSDVPIGVFLSGGIDSSLVAALAARKSAGKIQTFCIGFQESRFDESEFSSAIAKHIGTRHCSLRAETNLLDLLPEITQHFGEPFADSSALALSAIAKHARSFITVALSGDGGDEGFAGYAWYENAARLDRIGKLVPPRVARLGARAARWANSRLDDRRTGRAARAFTVLQFDSAERFAALRSFINEGEVEILYDGELLERRHAELNPAKTLLSDSYERASGSALRRMRYADISTYLSDDLMTKVDVSTMAHSLEARAPLLDQEVIAFGLSLPDHFLIDEGGGKRILRDLLARYVPRPMFERRKQGFSVPLQLWFSRQLRPQLDALADSEALSELGLLKRCGVRQLVSEHAAGTRDHSQRLFSILQLNNWLIRQ